jgi:MFS family permease
MKKNLRVWLLGKLPGIDIIHVLSQRPYFYFSLSVIFSQIAFNMLNLILIFLIFYLTSSNFSVAILVLIFLIPQIIFSFIGGVVADRINKRKILIIGNILRAGALIILFFNIHSAIVIYLVALLVAITTQFYTPAEPPLIPLLIKREHLLAANSVFSLNLFGSILVAYVLAGPAVTLLGRTHVFILISFLFLCASLSAFFVPASKKPSITLNGFFADVRRSIRQELHDSFSLLRSSRILRGPFFLLAFSQSIIMILATVIPGYAKTVLHIPTEDVSLLLFTPAALGMMITALGVGSYSVSAYNRNRLMNAGLFISGLSLAVFPFTVTLAQSQSIQVLNTLFSIHINAETFVLILAFFAGVGNAILFIPSQAVIQEHTPEDFRSKIYGLLFAMVGIFSLIPVLLAGGFADIFGTKFVLIIIGVGILLVGVLRIEFLNYNISLYKKIFRKQKDS